VTDFIRFPRTPHLAWLGAGEPRDDKILAAEEVRDLLAQEVIVEKKLDGANLGISVGADGALRIQSRGAFLDLASLHPQFRPLRNWLAVHQRPLSDTLAGGQILFGEWSYARHSIHYTRLPDWFIAFDVYDPPAGHFWSVPRRDALIHGLGIRRAVPCPGSIRPAGTRTTPRAVPVRGRSSRGDLRAAGPGRPPRTTRQAGPCGVHAGDRRALEPRPGSPEPVGDACDLARCWALTPGATHLDSPAADPLTW
jgi:hypothetical protein